MVGGCYEVTNVDAYPDYVFVLVEYFEKLKNNFSELLNYLKNCPKSREFGSDVFSYYVPIESNIKLIKRYIKIISIDNNEVKLEIKKDKEKEVSMLVIAFVIIILIVLLKKMKM